jgi:hypothetical protein
MAGRTITVDGRKFDVDRTDGPNGTVTDRFPGIGLVGSERTWRGTGRGGLRWWAARNPSGEDGRATAHQGSFSSRRSAIRWLLSETIS